ncbi:hypothetical protein ACFL6C_05555 [Myxococcota bacterium]
MPATVVLALASVLACVSACKSNRSLCENRIPRLWQRLQANREILEQVQLWNRGYGPPEKRQWKTTHPRGGVFLGQAPPTDLGPGPSRPLSPFITFDQMAIAPEGIPGLFLSGLSAEDRIEEIKNATEIVEPIREQTEHLERTERIRVEGLSRGEEGDARWIREITKTTGGRTELAKRWVELTDKAPNPDDLRGAALLIDRSIPAREVFYLVELLFEQTKLRRFDIAFQRSRPPRIRWAQGPEGLVALLKRRHDAEQRTGSTILWDEPLHISKAIFGDCDEYNWELTAIAPSHAKLDVWYEVAADNFRRCGCHAEIEHLVWLDQWSIPATFYRTLPIEIAPGGNRVEIQSADEKWGRTARRLEKLAENHDFGTWEKPVPLRVWFGRSPLPRLRPARSRATEIEP